MENNKLWFKAKRYGWGWYPCSWEGWLTILLWVFLFVLINAVFKNDFTTKTLIYRFVFIFVSLFILIYICYKKGEKPYWRWGGPRDEDK